MASRKQPRTPEAMRGINGVVVSLSLDKHACIIMIEELRGRERNLGIFDTSRLEERLEGVSSLNQPYFIAKRAKLKFMIAIPMTLERKQELGWDKGDWEIVSVQPYDSRRDVRLLPQQYFVKAGYGRGDYSPTMAYCRQNLPHTSETGPSPEMIGHTIHLFRKLVGAWNNFPVREVLTVIKNNENFSDVREYFQTLQDIVTFLKSYPQYFSLKDANKTAFIPNRFMEDKLYKFLASNAARCSLSERVDVEYELIETVDVCKRHVARLLDRVSQSTSPIIAFGCEAIHSGKEGSLTLLQIGTVEGKVFIFDLLATPKREDMFTTGGLKRLLEEKHIKKVMYDCRDPQDALFFQFGVVLKNVFDVSAAFATIWDQCNFMSGPFRPSSPSELLQAFGLQARHKTEEFEKEMTENRLFQKRPLTEEMIEYVVDDAKCWVPKVYESLNRLISPLWRPEFEEKVERLLEECRTVDVVE